MDILKEFLQIFATEAANAAALGGVALQDHIEEIRQIENFPNGGLRFAVTTWRNERTPPRITKEMSLIEVLTLIGSVIAVYAVIPAVKLLEDQDLKR